MGGQFKLAQFFRDVRSKALTVKAGEAENTIRLDSYFKNKKPDMESIKKANPLVIEANHRAHFDKTVESMERFMEKHPEPVVWSTKDQVYKPFREAN